MNNLRAVLFDFDGTLIDSYAAITASVNHVRAARGLAPLPEAEVRRFIGHGPQHLLTHTVPGTDWEIDWPRYRDHHPGVMRSMTRLLPGAREALDQVKRSGRKAGVCSNKPRLFTQELVEFFEVAEFFDTLLGPEDVAQPKPAPDMLLAALDRLELRPEQTLYIGDMIVDITTARAAGVPVWAVATGLEELPTLIAAKPDRILRDLHELAELLKR